MYKRPKWRRKDRKQRGTGPKRKGDERERKEEREMKVRTTRTGGVFVPWGHCVVPWLSPRPVHIGKGNLCLVPIFLLIVLCRLAGVTIIIIVCCGPSRATSNGNKHMQLYLTWAGETNIPSMSGLNYICLMCHNWTFYCISMSSSDESQWSWFYSLTVKQSLCPSFI